MARSLRNSKVDDFEPKRKNPIGLLDDSYLDSHLKSLKIGDKSTPLLMSDNELRINGDFYLDGDFTAHKLSTEEDYFDIQVSSGVGYVQFYPSDFSFSSGYTPYQLYTDVLGNVYHLTASGSQIYSSAGGFTWSYISGGVGTTTATLGEGGNFTLKDHDDTGDYFNINVGTHGATSLTTVDDDGAVGHLTLDPDGDLIFSGCDVKIDSGKDLYLDGGGDTYIFEHSADQVRHIVGGDTLMRMSEQGDDGNQVEFYDASVGFTQKEPSYDATNTDVDFRFSNKQFLTIGALSIVNLNLTFPQMSGNFVLLVKQDGTGGRTITNYKVKEFDESAADGSSGVKFAGGSNPTLTTDANHVDILSFYWDADNEICYGVATLDFQF